MSGLVTDSSKQNVAILEQLTKISDTLENINLKLNQLIGYVFKLTQK